MPDPQTQKTLDVVRRFNEAVNRHDVDAVMTLMTTDCVFENTVPPPDGERFVGSAVLGPRAIARCSAGPFTGTIVEDTSTGWTSSPCAQSTRPPSSASIVASTTSEGAWSRIDRRS